MKLGFSALLACLALGPVAAGATGTATIVQANGRTNVYEGVSIKVIHGVLYMTTADGKGTLIINRAACSHQEQLLVCLATSATLVQSGQTSPLDFKRGTVYANDTGDYQPMVMTTTKLPPHSILFSMTTKRGTVMSLSGRLDEVVK